jgi:hypothetical protein
MKLNIVFKEITEQGGIVKGSGDFYGSKTGMKLFFRRVANEPVERAAHERPEYHPGGGGGDGDKRIEEEPVYEGGLDVRAADDPVSYPGPGGKADKGEYRGGNKEPAAKARVQLVSLSYVACAGQSVHPS